MKNTIRTLAALALLLSPAAAEAGSWRWSITPYAWATDVGVDARVSGDQVVDATITVGELMEDLDTIVQLRGEGQNGAHGVMLDLFDVTLSDRVSGVALPAGAGSADFASDMGMTILDVAGFYDFKGDRRGLALLYGTRVLNERATVDATFFPAGGSAVEQSYETNDTMVDALVGFRMKQPFSRHWGVQMQADVSTGGTDHTWSAGSSLNYAFGTMGRHAVSAGYRTMQVDFQDEAGLDTRMKLSGVLVGFRTSF